jgi:5-aminolevulinate synthase
LAVKFQSLSTDSYLLKSKLSLFRLLGSLFPPSTMDKLSSLTRFKAACPFLGRTKTSTLRSLSTSSSPGFPSLSALTERATKCPVMGPALSVRSKEIVAGYASVAANSDVEKIHKDKGVFPPAGATIEMCPHASAARAAARMAEDLSAAAAKQKVRNDTKHAKEEEAAAAAAAGCPFHQKAVAEAAAAQKAATAAAPKSKDHTGFDYEHFYISELDKKHQDKSYRYFNNINRLAAKFPIAHTGSVKDEVEVWCANDYLGMGNNPVVLETMQYVFNCVVLSHPQYSSLSCSAVLLINMAMVQAELVILLATAPCTCPSNRSLRICTANQQHWSSLPAT